MERKKKAYQDFKNKIKIIMFIFHLIVEIKNFNILIKMNCYLF